jgi:PadR family transcriptional regulator PadR
MDTRMSVLQGTLDVLVLRTLARGPMHGYEISRAIDGRTGGELEIHYAPLYKALHRLARARCVTAAWGATEHGRRARYYTLTPRGREHLANEVAAWRRYASAVSRVLEPA